MYSGTWHTHCGIITTALLRTHTHLAKANNPRTSFEPSEVHALFGMLKASSEEVTMTPSSIDETTKLRDATGAAEAAVNERASPQTVTPPRTLHAATTVNRLTN